MNEIPLEDVKDTIAQQSNEELSSPRKRTLNYIIFSFITLLICILLIYFIKKNTSSFKNLSVELFRNINVQSSENKNYFNIFLNFSPISLYSQLFKVKITAFSDQYFDTDKYYHFDLNSTQEFFNNKKTISQKSKTNQHFDLTFYKNASKSSSFNIFQGILRNTTPFQINLQLSCENIQDINTFTVTYRYWTPCSSKYIIFIRTLTHYFGFILIFFLRKKNFVIFGIFSIISTNPLSFFMPSLDEYSIYFICYSFYLISLRCFENQLFMNLIDSQSMKYMICSISFPLIEVISLFFCTNFEESFSFIGNRKITKINAIFMILCEVLSVIPILIISFSNLQKKFSIFLLNQLVFVCFVLFDIAVSSYSIFLEYFNNQKNFLPSHSIRMSSHIISSFVLCFL